MLRNKIRAAVLVLALVAASFATMVHPAPAQAYCITIPAQPPLIPAPIELCFSGAPDAPFGARFATELHRSPGRSAVQFSARVNRR